MPTIEISKDMEFHLGLLTESFGAFYSKWQKEPISLTPPEIINKIVMDLGGQVMQHDPDGNCLVKVPSSILGLMVSSCLFVNRIVSEKTKPGNN